MPYDENGKFRQTIKNAIYFNGYIADGNMSSLLEKSFKGFPGIIKEMNLFIDLNSILKSVFSINGTIDMYNSKETDPTRDILNICGNYRRILKRIGVHTKIFLVFGNNYGSEYFAHVPDYNDYWVQRFSSKYFKHMVQTNFDILKQLCPLIPDLYLVTQEVDDIAHGVETSVIISYLINKLNEKTINLIISNDLYAMQLCVNHPLTAMLHISKNTMKGHYGEDRSSIIPIREKNSFRQDFWNIWTIRTNAKKDDEKMQEKISSLDSISPINFPLFLALNKFTKRNIRAIYSWDKATKAIYKATNGENIKISVDYLANMDVLPPHFKYDKNLVYESIANRQFCLDTSFMYPVYEKSPHAKSIVFQDIQDTTGKLEYLNSKYFSDDPIYLDSLMNI